MNHKIGLALGGGGARGSFQLGVVKALRDLGVLEQILYVSGTSIGAINTLMIMNGLSDKRMLEIWNKIDNSGIYGDGPDRFKEDKQGIFSLQDLYDLVKKELSISEIKESKIHGFATTTKIPKESLIDQVIFSRMEKKVFYLNDMKDPTQGALASASMPILFGPSNIKDDYYIDGGVKDNCPVQPLIEQGCDIVIAVPVHYGLRPKKYRDSNILLIGIEPHYLFNPFMTDVVNFDPKEIPHRIEYGVMLTEFVFNKLQEQNLFDKKNSTWYKPKDYRYIRISRDEEIKLKFLGKDN
ncbi:MAG: patatin-like phospholipase family protein [Acholeplasmataceae bacterium]